MHKIKLEVSIYLEDQQTKFPYIGACLFTSSSVATAVLVLDESPIWKLSITKSNWWALMDFLSCV